MAKKKDKVNLVFVLDNTGSMQDYKGATISGYNEYLKSLKKQKIDYTMTLILFNSVEVEHRYEDIPLADAAELTDKTYQPDHSTPLYDAVATAINRADERYKKKDKVLFTVMTDGYENASREYSQQAVFEMITKHREKGWEFMFLGANQDAWAVGIGMGVKSSSISDYHQAKTGQTFAVASAAAMRYSTGEEELITDDERRSIS